MSRQLFCGSLVFARASWASARALSGPRFLLRNFPLGAAVLLGAPELHLFDRTAPNSFPHLP